MHVLISCNFSGPFAVMDEHFGTVLPNSFDAIGIMLMIRITHQHQVTTKVIIIIILTRIINTIIVTLLV